MVDCTISCFTSQPPPPHPPSVTICDGWYYPCLKLRDSTYITLVFNSFNLCRSSNSSLEVSKIMFSVLTINDANFKSFSCKRISAKVR